MLDSFLHGDFAPTPTALPVLALALLLAFLLGQLMAWIYMATHQGLSYSRAFVLALVILPVIVALVMTVLANSFVTAFGLMAVFAIVRFRNVLRDTLETAYVLAAIVVGMACGTQKFTTAVVGGAVLGSIMVYVWLTRFGLRHQHDFILNLQWTRPAAELGELRRLLTRHARRQWCVIQQADPTSTSTELSYHLQLRDPDRAAELVRELSALPGATLRTAIAAAQEAEL